MTSNQTPRVIYTYAYRLEQRRHAKPGDLDIRAAIMELRIAHPEIASRAEWSFEDKQWKPFTGYANWDREETKELSRKLFCRRHDWQHEHSPALAPDEIPF